MSAPDPLDSRLSELEATVAYLTRRLEQATSATGILAAAGMPAIMPAPAPPARRARPRHLQVKVC
jgi:hypothetical protein